MLIMTMKRLQMNLKYLRYYDGEIDGIKGTKTLNAIKNFQKDNNLAVDGIAGQKTIDCIRAIIVSDQQKFGVTVDGVAGEETTNARYNYVENNISSWSDIKYFKESEFTCKCGCGLNNIKLTIVKIADQVREHFGSPAIVTSGCRCTKHNKNVGGVANSRHLDGKAIDFYVQGISGNELVQFTKTLVDTGLLRYTYRIGSTDAVHIDIV